MILLDSSGWIDVFTASRLAGRFIKELGGGWVVSTINLFEVYRKIARGSEDQALEAIAYMQQGKVVDVSSTLALEAGDLSLRFHLGMADSIILATAYQQRVPLLSKDSDFSQIPGCRVLR